VHAARELAKARGVKSPFRPLLLALAALGLPHAAAAHAIIVESQPAPNATVDTTATSLQLRFNSRIDIKRSRVTLNGPGPASPPVPVPLEETDQPDRMIGRLAGLKPGDYKIKWQVLAVDGHITRGEIPFRVETR
jgi:methionine-rich copper-binding protein CopC